MVNNCAVQIAIRERGHKREAVKDNIISYLAERKNVLIVEDRPFTFDHVMGPEVSQAHLFDALVKPLVAKFREGFNCTALAYGQTGTGKTYTMGLDCNNSEGDHIGVIPRSFNQIFAFDANENCAPCRQISLSFIEIYNERVFDLLAGNSTEPVLSRGWKNFTVTRKPVSNIAECETILMEGNKNRHVRPTNMNTQSSRSHAVFTIRVSRRDGDKATSTCFNFVDLAGSEGVRRTGHQGVAKTEGVHINQGLLGIGKVLQAMALGNKVIPYRDSVLSLVLQDSLSPNSYLTLLACISPCREDLGATLSTLRFAQSAKLVKHTPEVHAILTERKKNRMRATHNARLSERKRLPTPISNYKLPSTVQRTGVRHANTFCTPTQIRKISSNKFNRSGIGLTPKEKEKARQAIAGYGMVPGNRESLFDLTMDSTCSLLSFNTSTSTAVNAAADPGKPTSYSPLVRKCMAEFETVMENKLMKIMGNLKQSIDENKEATRTDLTMLPNSNTNTNTNTTTNRVEKTLPVTIRSELKSLIKEILNENTQMATANKCSDTSLLVTSTTEPVVPRQLFATSSPVFKVPEVPKFIENNNSLQMSLRSSFDRSQCSDAATDDSVVGNRTKLRRSLRLQQTLERRRSKRVQVQLNVSQSHLEQNAPKKKNRLVSIDELLLLPSTSSSTAAVTLSSSSKKARITTHRKAVLQLLNSGSIKQLQVLSQIGQKTAYQLIIQRSLNGAFKSLAQVEKLPIWRGNTWERFAKANNLTQ